MNDGRPAIQETISTEALKAGDRAEFARLVETYSGVIYRLALKLLQNQQDAEDVLQDTFIKAFKHIGNFDGRSRLSTWLYRIATNEALMMLRRRKKQVFSLDDGSAEADEDQTPVEIKDWCCLPEEELMSAEARAHLDEAIDTLPHTLRVVFLLRDIEGLSTQETGEVLNLSETAVKTRLSRARLRLREQLTTYFSRSLPTRQEIQEGG